MFTIKDLTIIGDVHGKIDPYLEVINEFPRSLQIGDMGLGFEGVILPEMDNHKFIRGNHDCPRVCQEHPNYMGEYGYSDEFEIYYIGGAYSIDWTYRVEGVSWWNDEELSQAELRKVIDHVLEIKPHTIISHDCPQSILTEMFNIIPIGTRTGQAFDAIFEKHQPDIWIFGHHHRDITQEINNTKFICLDELSTLEI